MKTVKDLIESKTKTFNVVESNTLVIDALSMLNSVNLSYLIVMDGHEFKGIFSERDYARNLILKGRSSTNTPVKEVMSTDFPFVELNDTVEYCMNLMNTRKTRYLLAFDKGAFVGVVTIHDLLRQVIFNREDVFDYSATIQLLDADENSRIF
ncbi:MAG TPA: CBS domain-containing protein [Puia sp.]|nr:CBS domain-containing protein [Puia sp.]